MRLIKPSAKKFKRVYEDFPNLAILTKSATPGKIELTFIQTAVLNKSLGESVVAFVLAVNLSSPSVIHLEIKIAFCADRDKIRLPIAGVLLRATFGVLARSKKQRDWTLRNTIF